MELTIALSVLGLMFWGCVAIIAGHYGIGLYAPFGLLMFFQHYAGPWVTLIGGYKLLNQARTWRRLHNLREQPTPLTRDPNHRASPASDRPSGLERGAVLMMAVAAISLVYWFDLPEPEFLLAAALLVWFFKNFVLRVLRRRGGR